MTHHHRALILVITLLAALTTLCAFPSFSHHALLIAILTPPLALAGIHALFTHRSPPILSASATIAFAIALATLRLLLATPHPLPEPLLTPTTLHDVRARALSQPDPTPQGWSIAIEDLTTHHRYLASLPPETPLPLPGDILAIDALTLRPTPARSYPHTPHPLERLRDADLHAYARIHTISHITPPRDPNLLDLALRPLARGRLQLIETLRHRFEPDQASILLAMLLGSKRLLPDHVREPLAVTGTAHLLAISGLHLSTLAILLVFVLRLVLGALAAPHVLRHGMNRLTHPITAAILSLYVLLIGAPPSALRALTMTLLLLLAHASNRRPAPHLILFAALTILCLLDPLLTRHPALWLSAAATNAILLAVLPKSVAARGHNATPHLRPHVEKLRQLATISLFAFLGTAPIILHLQHELPILLAIPLNMILVPLVSLMIFPLMVLGATLLPIFPELASMLLDLSSSLMLHIATLCDILAATCSPHGLMRPPNLPAWHLPLLLAITTACLVGLTRASRLHARALLVILPLTLPTLLATPHEEQHHGTLRVDFLPVGQGDATLVTFPDGATMLVDAGGATLGRDPGAYSVLPWLRQRGIAQLDWLLLTHPDADHMFGMFAIARHAPPRTFLTTSGHEDPHHTSLLDALSARGARIEILDRETNDASQNPLTHQSFTHAGVKVDLWVASSTAHLSKNDRSVVLALDYATHTLLLTGDIEASAEELLTPHLPRDVTLLKAPHHGSKTSSTPTLLEHTTPLHALFSCGLANRFGHPHPQVVQRYQALGAAIHRTDLHGLVTATVDPHGTFSITRTPQLP